MIFRVFPYKYLQNTHRYLTKFPVLHENHIQNLSNCFRHKYDQSISQIFQPYFWRGFVICKLCVAAAAAAAVSWSVCRRTAPRCASSASAYRGRWSYESQRTVMRSA